MTESPSQIVFGEGAISRRALLAGGAAMGLGALVAACSPSTNSSGHASASPASDSGHVPGAAALRTTFQDLAKSTTTPGAALMYRTPDGTMSATYGSGSTMRSLPITLADHFRIGSATKTFTGTVILQLAQEGKLHIDDPVSKYRGDVPNGANITLTQLLNMRSGLYNYSESLELNQGMDDNPKRIWTNEELLALAFKYPPDFPPGQGYHYSNTNFILLGLIAEKVDGRSLSTSFQKRLFDPVGMRNTLFPAAGMSTLPSPHPEGYMYGTNVSTMKGAELPADQQAAAAAGTLKPHDVTVQDPSWAWAAGSAISTAEDMTKWVTAMGNGSLLDAAWQKKRMESFQPVNPAAPTGPAYGFAIARLGPMFGHTGELPGFQTFIAYDPAKKRALVVLANLNSAPDGRAVSSTIAQGLIAKIYQ